MKKLLDDPIMSELNYRSEKQGEYHSIDAFLKDAYIVGRDYKGKTTQTNQTPSMAPTLLPRAILLSILRNTRQYKVIKKMLNLLAGYNKVRNWQLAQCIKPNLTKSNYCYKKKEWDKKIKNRERTLRKLLKPSRLTIRFSSENSQLTTLN